MCERCDQAEQLAHDSVRPPPGGLPEPNRIMVRAITRARMATLQAVKAAQGVFDARRVDAAALASIEQHLREAADLIAQLRAAKGSN